jgi:hypothetical protein
VDIGENFYYLNEKGRKWIEHEVFTRLYEYFDNKLSIVKRAIRTKEYLISINSKNERLRILKEEHQKYLSEVYEKYTDVEFAIFDGDMIMFEINRLFFIENLDKLLVLKNKKITLIDQINFFEKDGEEFNRLNKYIEMLCNALLFSWLLEQIEIETETQDENKSENKNQIKPETYNSEPLPNKLKWTGAKNQLYDVIRQLKKKQLISNSYLEITHFICDHFEKFEKNFPTVLKEIQKEQRPTKNKRIDLNLSDLPESDENLSE